MPETAVNNPILKIFIYCYVVVKYYYKIYSMYKKQVTYLYR